METIAQEIFLFSKDIHGQLAPVIYRRKQVWVLWKTFRTVNSFDNFMLYGHGLALTSQLRSLNDSADSSKRFNGVKVRWKRECGIHGLSPSLWSVGALIGQLFVLHKVLNVLTITLSDRLTRYTFYTYFSIYLQISPLIATTNIDFA